MSIIERIKKGISSNPISKIRINRLRKSLKKTDVTLLTPNCLGGILFHDLGLRFLSPTINLMMTQTDFLKFVLNMDDYLNGEIHFIRLPEYTCPCARLRIQNGNDTIVIYFTHYVSEQEALDKWYERKKRIDKNNIFIFIEERDGLTKQDIQKLSLLKAKGIVAFTCNKYDDIPYAVYLDKYNKDGEVGNILKKNHLTGSREYEKYFDFVKWFNEADGAPYIVEPFCK